MVDIYKEAWAVVKKDYVAWLLLYGVFFLVVTFTMGIGGVLFPNVLRESRDAIRESRAPGIGPLFDFTHIANDLFNYGVYYVALALASFVGLTFIPQIALSWQMMLAAEDRYSPVDNAKLSLKHVTAHLGDHVIFMLIASAIVLPTLCLCLLPLPFVLPIIGAATVVWYEREKDNFDAMAEEAGIPRLVTG
jgi:hypothetical protein